MREYDIIVVGAGYAGIGFSLGRQDVLVLEKNEMPGSDYHSVLRPANGVISASDDLCNDFLDFLKINGIVKDNKIDILRSGIALCKYIDEYCVKPDIILDAQIISVTQEERGFRVEYRTNEGIHTAYAEKVIDTTFLFDSAPDCVKVETRYLHTVLSNMPDGYRQKLISVNKNISFTDGFYENECYASFSFYADTPLFKARAEIENCVLKAFDGKQRIIDAVGFEYDDVARQVTENAVLWVPPHSFDNPIMAFDYGCKMRKNYEIL